LPDGRSPRLTPLDPWLVRLVGLDGVAAPVVVGCSGGPDSLALLALAAAADLGPVAVNVDHGVRSGSARDAVVVARAAARFGATARTVAIEVDIGPNFEARARDARYDALEQVRAEVGAGCVLVGHTADDQAETVLLNFLRGSAAAGLGGMPVRRDTIVRPLLELRRADTEAICRDLGLEPVRDPMNRDRTFRRVWVREEVLPALAAGAERDLVPLLVRQAEVLRSESEYLDELARAAWPPDANHAPAMVLARLPVPLARRAVRHWLGLPPPSFEEVERVLAVARGQIRATEVAARGRVERRRGELYLVRGSVTA
jgi:tRNA(Ile)-lysidine synthase